MKSELHDLITYYHEDCYMVINNNDMDNQCPERRRNTLEEAKRTARHMSNQYIHDEIVIVKVTETFQCRFVDGKEIDEKERE